MLTSAQKTATVQMPTLRLAMVDLLSRVLLTAKGPLPHPALKQVDVTI
jgi:hypothetical protein